MVLGLPRRPKGEANRIYNIQDCLRFPLRNPLDNLFVRFYNRWLFDTSILYSLNIQAFQNLLTPGGQRQTAVDRKIPVSSHIEATKGLIVIQGD